MHHRIACFLYQVTQSVVNSRICIAGLLRALEKQVRDATSLQEERGQACYCVTVINIRADRQFEYRQSVQINCVILGFCCRSLWAEIPLLSNNLRARSALCGRPAKNEFLSPRCLQFLESELNPVN